MGRAERRRKIREKARNLLRGKYNKDKHPRKSRQERKSLALLEAKDLVKEGVIQ